MKLFEKTDYPAIYIHTYWGSADESMANVNNPDVIENRNKFIRDYKIKGLSNIDHEPGDPKVFDHLELYRSHDKSIILICSPYSEVPEDRLQELGLKRIYNLYSDRTFTYCRKFNRIGEVRRLLM